jgi:hypothetical protein
MGRINWEMRKKNRKMKKLEAKGRITHNFKVVGSQETAVIA